MFAHGRAREVDAVALARYADQGEVAGAASHVAHQHRLPVEQALARPRQVIHDPGVKRRRRFFEQRQLLDSRVARRGYGQLARLLVEARRNGQHYIVVAYGCAVLLAPRLGEPRENPCGDLHWRKHPSSFLRVPRQDFRRAVDLGIRQPALRRMHALGGDNGALFPRKSADILAVAQIKKRGQRAPRLDASLRYILRRLLNLNRRRIGFRSLLRIDESEGGVGGAEVDPDIHPAWAFIPLLARPAQALCRAPPAANPPSRPSSLCAAADLLELSRSPKLRP